MSSNIYITHTNVPLPLPSRMSVPPTVDTLTATCVNYDRIARPAAGKQECTMCTGREQRSVAT